MANSSTTNPSSDFSKVRYLFMARCANDIDHMVPIISALLDEGVEAHTIKYVTLIPHPSINPKGDKRIRYIAERGVQLEAPYLQHVEKRIARVAANADTISPLFSLPAKVGRYYFAKLTQKSLTPANNANWLYIKQIVESMEENGCVVFDENIGTAAKEISKICKSRNLHYIAVPHGFPLHMGFDHPVLDRLLTPTPYKNSDKIYTSFICPNPWSAKKAAIRGIDNIQTLGSTRFSPEWVKQLDKIYPIKKHETSKLKVAVVVEKAGVYINNKPYEFLDIEEQFKAIEYLAKHKEVELKIKGNARGLYGRQAAMLRALSPYIASENTTTGELFTWADAVVGCCSSVLLDAVVKRKPLIQLRYATQLKMSFYKERLGWQPTSFDEFSWMVEKLIQDTDSFAYNRSGFENTMNFYVYGGQEPHNVPESYARYLHTLAGDE
ncbi:MAG: hypothetical protein ACNI27_13970 [Desulfovibrio sp.]